MHGPVSTTGSNPTWYLLIGPYVFDGERFVWPTTETTDFRTGISTDGEWQFFVAGD